MSQYNQTGVDSQARICENKKMKVRKKENPRRVNYSMRVYETKSNCGNG